MLVLLVALLGIGTQMDFISPTDSMMLNKHSEVRVEERRIMRRIGISFGMVVATATVAMAFRGFQAGGGPSACLLLEERDREPN
ncbi:hypothetical protein Patl1_10963 [Pistacia atlantica]|uniref:Uncharacterized protein n=1 Tax=Pistacia atlantica TaxID=434234 RepID=A0ACC1A7Z7_9ROSI|nr:hypothetical protein Patl1_10963 [Pistacia atlantica]